jgi:predicted nucleic acid-binding protein
MGLILDSSVVIAAERRGDTVERLIERVVSMAGDQEAALSAVGLTELVHGLYRAQTPEMRVRREAAEVISTVLGNVFNNGSVGLAR